MKKQRYLILIMLFITCAITLLYGKNRVQVVQGEKNPDIVKNINNNITMQYTQSSIEYFSNEVQSLSQIEEESEVIIKAKILENRVMSARSTKTQVLIEEIYKDTNKELSKGNMIFFIEPASFLRGEVYYTHGYQMVQTGDSYILFLKHLECIEGYVYTDEEKISFMPTSELFARFNLSEEESIEVFQNESSIKYTEVEDYALFTIDKNKVELYKKFKNDVIKKYGT